MRVVATAGHVDHGKSTLVRALTGMEPDRLDEERRRGLTIDLGFAWTAMPTGEELAFVDVPGHERFVTTMLAGVGPVPAIMFVVAADEGWKPQSTEHLDAIDALRIEHGLLVVTRADLADPQPAIRVARRQLAETSLGHIETVTVSGVTGEGMDSLRSALYRLADALPDPDPRAPVRFWIDRSFGIRGAGTVVTGTLPAGTVRVGDELQLTPDGRRFKIRGLQALQQDRDHVSAVSRVAMNVRGLDRADARRGMALVTPGEWTLTHVLDVRLRYPVDRLPRELVVHLGSAAVTAHIRQLGTVTARVTLPYDIPAHIGDRALLRDPGQRQVVAGVTVLDVAPPPLRRRGAARARARELDATPGSPDGRAVLRQRGMIRRSELAAMGCRPPEAPRVGDVLIDPDLWARLRQRLIEIVNEHRSRDPLTPSIPLEAARRALGLPDRRLVEALAGETRDQVVFRDGGLAAPGREPDLPPQVRRAVDAIRNDLEASPFAAPEKDRLASLGLNRRALAAAVRTGALLRVADGIYLLPDAPERAAHVLRAVSQPFTVADARTALGTTRRVAVPLLELMDAEKLTERISDTHRRVVERS